MIMFGIIHSLFIFKSILVDFCEKENDTNISHKKKLVHKKISQLITKLVNQQYLSNFNHL